jgi:predicted component of type VI protein secretion system
MILLNITCAGNSQEAVFFKEEVISIGRSPKNNIQLPDKKASRKHCLIEQHGHAYRVVDLGSSNGTRVNGEKVDSKEIKKGDKINTGHATIVVKEIGWADQTTKPSIGTAATKPAAAAAAAPAAARPRPVPSGAAAASERNGPIKIHRGPREMPMGLLDYILILVIILLVLYIAGVLLTVLKEKFVTDIKLPISTKDE